MESEVGRGGGFWDYAREDVGGTKGRAEMVLYFPRALTANTNFRRWKVNSVTSLNYRGNSSVSMN